MKAYKKIMNGVAVFEKVVISAILIFITALTFVNVVVRKLSSSQFAWSEELVINLFVLTIMLGCALAVREGSMITLSLIFDQLKRRGQKIFLVIITVANIAFWGILLKTGYTKVLSQMASGKLTSSLGWPEWLFTIFLPIGAVFLILHTVEYFLDFMAGNVGVEEKEEAGIAE